MVKKSLVLIVVVPFVTSCYELGSILKEEEIVKQINKEKILKLVNEARVSGRYCGDEYFEPVSALEWNEKLEIAAQVHSDDMNTNDFFSHKGSDGLNAGDRLKAAGYRWSTWGENIAKGYITEEDVINGWLKSEGHCRNIMNKNFVHIGVAKSGEYWTMVLAAPAE